MEDLKNNIENLFPFSAIHKTFGEVEILGCRKGNESVDNFLYLFELDGNYVWGYSYEITFLEHATNV